MEVVRLHDSDMMDIAVAAILRGPPCFQPCSYMDLCEPRAQKNNLGVK